MRVPKSWSDVTIRQYYNLIEALELPLSDEDRAVAMLSALTDIPIETLTDKTPISVLIKSIKQMDFISDTKPKGAVRAYLKLAGKRIEFDLILRDSNANSFISLVELNKNPQTAKNNIHSVIAIFCHEVNWFGKRKERTIQNQRELAEHIKNNMTMDDAFRYRDFFLFSYEKLQRSTLAYLDLKRKKIQRDLRKVIVQSS